MSRPTWLRRRWRNRRGTHVTFFDAYPEMHAGAQRMLGIGGSGLPERGWTVDVVLPGPGRLVSVLAEQGISVAVEQAPAALARSNLRTTPWAAVRGIVALPGYWWRLARRLARTPGVVHVQDHRGLILAGPAVVLARRPLVWHVHAIQPASAMNAIGAVLADRVAVPSLTALARMPGLDRRGNVSAIRNAVEPGRAATVRRPADDQLVVSLGRLHPDKAYGDLLEAVHIARRSVAGLRVVIAGAAQAGHEAHAAHLADRVAALGLEGCVSFAGFVPEPVELFEQASVYVQSSLEATELLPVAILEAMASGVPVISTCVGAVADVIVDGVTGALVPPGDPIALAGALERVLLDRPFAEALGAAGAARVRASFTPEGVVEDLVALYSPLAGGA
jgi:glycosyltransferase involved in cell wall biosynthesis